MVGAYIIMEEIIKVIITFIVTIFKSKYKKLNNFFKIINTNSKFQKIKITFI